jgi:hypothetical protein
LADVTGHRRRFSSNGARVEERVRTSPPRRCYEGRGFNKKIRWGQVRTTYTNGNDAPIYNVGIIVTYILKGEEYQQRFDEPMVHPGTHEQRWAVDADAVFANTEIRFTDGNSHRWSRTQQGIFKDLGVIEYA